MHDDENESSNCMVDLIFFFLPPFINFVNLILSLKRFENLVIKKLPNCTNMLRLC